MRQNLPPGQRSRLLACLMHKVVPTGEGRGGAGQGGGGAAADSAAADTAAGRRGLVAGQAGTAIQLVPPCHCLTLFPGMPPPTPPHTHTAPAAGHSYSMLRSSKTVKTQWHASWQQRGIHFAKSHVGMALQVRTGRQAVGRMARLGWLAGWLAAGVTRAAG